MQYSFIEELPKGCPFNGAKGIDSDFIRVIKNSSPKKEDFISHYSLYGKDYGDECKAKGVSIFDNPDGAKRILKFPSHKNGKLCKITLKKSDGPCIKTGTNGHFTWWVDKSFSISKFEIV